MMRKNLVGEEKKKTMKEEKDPWHASFSDEMRRDEARAEPFLLLLFFSTSAKNISALLFFPRTRPPR